MKLKIIFLFALSVSLNSCFLLRHKFKITDDFIKSNKSFYQGFRLSELIVDSISQKGVPIVFDRVNSASVYINDPKGKQSKKIFFCNPNSNYSWHYQQEWDLPVAPIKMKKNNWYLIDGLVFFGNPTLSKFIFIDNLGGCHTYTMPKSTNW